MRTGYTIKVEQHEQIRELTTKVEALMEGVDPRVRIAALNYLLVQSIGDLAEVELPEFLTEKLWQRLTGYATGLARQINPLSRDT